MFKKKDMVIIVLVLVVAAIMALVMNYGQGKAGGTVRIMIDGEEYGTYLILENRTIEVVSETGYNKVVLENGMVSMVEADCPDQYCVEHNAISKTNETIVCLPHKLVVEVLAPAEAGVIDSVAQ